MTETTETTERTPAEWCDVLADEAAASVALAASERDNVARHARLAAEAKQRGAMVDAADAASAAAAYARGAREAAIAAVAACNDVEATMRSFDVIGQAAGDEITPDVRAELDRIRATYDRASDSQGTARSVADEADALARGAGEGIDWLHYHLDGHCQHWRERVTT